jgi:Protein of unknown function (DUF1153)
MKRDDKDAPDQRSDPGADIIPPPPGTRAWGSRRKAAVVLSIREGLISREEAYAAYSLSPEELAAWEAAFDRGGHKALTNKAAPLRAAPTQTARGPRADSTQ